jgi:hypothetical protein
VLPDGFGSLGELLEKCACSSLPAFPFECELCRYLLFICSLWPEDKRRLVDGARIFSSSLNYHASHPKLRVSDADLKKFNEHVFDRIGGQKSMLFCPSVEDYHRDVWGRISDLMMLHDVVDYILKFCIVWREMASSKVAFAAVAHNIFKRKDGYGIKKGEKRRAMDPSMVTTPNTVRERWKNAPESMLLSYVLVRWVRIHVWDPGSIRFLISIRNSVEKVGGLSLSKLLSLTREMLKSQVSEQNRTLKKWAEMIGAASPISGTFYTCRPTGEELEQAFVLHDKLFKKPLAAEAKERVNAAIRGRALQIPATL